MANGDAAAAAGLATFAPTQDIRLGYDNDNIRGDELAAHLTNGTHPASAISSGILNEARIPGLDASKIVSGTLPDARIGSISTSKLVGVINNEINGTNNIATTGNINCNGALAAGSITTPGGVSAGGNGISTSGNIVGANTYNQTNTGRAMFVASNGLYGVGSSARRFKKNITDATINPDEVLQIRVRNFMYKKELDEAQTVHIGVIAEELVELGLEQFVFFNDQGEADGVAYEKLALALIPVLQNQEQRLQALENKVN